MNDTWLEGVPPNGRVHFMGVGGAGMSALAEAASRAGYVVTGCDAADGTNTAHLRSIGVDVLIGHGPDHLDDVDGLVITAAVSPDHPELARARVDRLPVVKRAVALGAWVRRGRLVAVSGTHGKTTTTAMTATVLDAAGLGPSAFVGGTVARWESNYLAGHDTLFVVEADEFDRSFLSLDPDIAIVTNVEADHLDIYGDREGVDEAFHAFLARVRDGGTVIACADDPGAARLVQSIRTPTVTYGLNPGSMLRAVNPVPSESGTEFEVWEEGRTRGRLTVPVPGAHNVRNALAAAAAARSLGVDWPTIRDGLVGFGGVGRRFQTIGTVGGVTVIDDYAHHPTEVEATLDAARRAFPERRIVAVFQPHLFSRTRDFHREFGRALAAADRVWVTGIYPAREAPIPGVTGELVAQAAGESGRSVRYHEPLDGLAGALARELEDGDVCLAMGAGSIERLGSELVAELSAVATPAPGGERGLELGEDQ